MRPARRCSGPATVGGKDVLSDEEAEEFQKQTRGRPDARSPRRRHRSRRQPRLQRALDGRAAAEDHRRPPHVADRRSARRTDSAAGAAVARSGSSARAARADGDARFAAGLPDDVTDMSLPVRCIIRTDSPPYLPTIYNNDFQIFQSPGYVAIAPEMIHSARIIPLDGRPHLDKNLQQWLGDTRGHWDGNTLVVETTNFRGDDGVVFQGANPATFTHHRALHARRRRHDQLRVHRSRIRRRGRSRGRR